MGNSSLCLITHHAMKTYWESGGIAPRILNLGTRWRWSDSFTLRSLYPRRKNLSPHTHWIWGWVDPRASLDAVAKRRNPIMPLPGIGPRSSIP